MIKLTLKEYKELRDKIEEYRMLIGDYKYLYHIYKEQLNDYGMPIQITAFCDYL